MDAQEALAFVLEQTRYGPAYGGKRLEEAEAVLRRALPPPKVLAEGSVRTMALAKYRDGYQDHFRVSRHRPTFGHRRVLIVAAPEQTE